MPPTRSSSCLTRIPLCLIFKLLGVCRCGKGLIPEGLPLGTTPRRGVQLRVETRLVNSELGRRLPSTFGPRCPSDPPCFLVLLLCCPAFGNLQMCVVPQLQPAVLRRYRLFADCSLCAIRLPLLELERHFADCRFGTVFRLGRPAGAASATGPQTALGHSTLSLAPFLKRFPSIHPLHTQSRKAELGLTMVDDTLTAV